MFSKLYGIFHTLFQVLRLNFDHYAAAGSLSPAAGAVFLDRLQEKPSGGDNCGTQWEYLPFITFSNCTPEGNAGGSNYLFFRTFFSFALFSSLQTAEPERLCLACSYWDEQPSKVSRKSGLWFQGRGVARPAVCERKIMECFKKRDVTCFVCSRWESAPSWMYPNGKTLRCHGFRFRHVGFYGVSSLKQTIAKDALQPHHLSADRHCFQTPRFARWIPMQLRPAATAWSEIDCLFPR